MLKNLSKLGLLHIETSDLYENPLPVIFKIKPPPMLPLIIK